MPRSKPRCSRRAGFFKDPILFFAGLMWVGFLSVGAGFFAKHVVYEKDLDLSGIRVQAELIYAHTQDPQRSNRPRKVDSQGREKREMLPTSYADYRFRTPDGREFEGKNKVITSRQLAELKPGDSILVVYSASNPEQNEAASFVEPTLGKKIFRILGIFVFLFASLPGLFLLRASTYEPVSDEEAMKAWSETLSGLEKKTEGLRN